MKELLAAPEVRLVITYTRRMLVLPDGHTVGVMSYSSTKSGNALYLIDARDLGIRRFDFPNGDIGSHGAAACADGNLYFMPYETGRAYRFEPGAGRFHPLRVDLPDREYTWDAIAGANGRIYFGTYPHACFGEYDPVTGSCQLWERPVRDTTYVCDLIAKPDGAILLKAFGPAVQWMRFDPVLRTLAPVQAPEPAAPVDLPAPAGDTRWIARQTAGGRDFALSYPSSRVWELAQSGPILRGDTGEPAQTGWLLAETTDGIVGVSTPYGRVFRFDLVTEDFRSVDLPNRMRAGNRIMFLSRISPRAVIGSNYSQQNLFVLDPVSGALTVSPTMVATVSGEPKCAVGCGGKAYLGVYIRSVLLEFDPAEAFSFGRNPRELARLGRGDPFVLEPPARSDDPLETARQTRPRDAVTDGRRVFISSDSEYNFLGGALAVVDTRTGAVTVHVKPAGEYDLPTLVWDPGTALLWGGTCRWGQMRSHPPVNPTAVVYAFDPETGMMVASIAPWPGTDQVDVQLIIGGLLLASREEGTVLIDVQRREIVKELAWPARPTSRVRQGRDGCGYFLSDGHLYRWDVIEGSCAPLAEISGSHLVELDDGRWLVADGGEIYRVP